MFNYTVPENSEILNTSTQFVALFNTPSYPNEYAFEGSVFNEFNIQELKKNTLYLLERYSISFSLSKEEFFNSINFIPYMLFKLSKTNEVLHNKPIQINNYPSESQITQWIFNQIEGNFLRIRLSGRFNQLPSMVGVNSVRMFLNLTFYLINDNGFINAWKNGCINQFTNKILIDKA